jgi:hypothetical protein
MIELLRVAVEQSIRDGYVGLWATGDMAWEFGSERNLGKLFDYERKLEQLMQIQPALSGVCQYHRDTLPDQALHIAVEGHKALYLNSMLSRLNPEYKYS